MFQTKLSSMTHRLWAIDYDLIRTLGVVLSCVLNFFSPDSVSIVSCTSRCVMVFFTVVTLNWKFTSLTHYPSNVPLYHHIQNFEQQYQRVRRVWYCVLHRAYMFLDQCNFSPKYIFCFLIFFELPSHDGTPIIRPI